MANLKLKLLIKFIIAFVVVNLICLRLFVTQNQQTSSIEEITPVSTDFVTFTTEVKYDYKTNTSNTWKCVTDSIGNTAITSVALLKVHKAGSSTVANILYRFGIRRGLSFVMTKRSHLFWPDTIDDTSKAFYPPCKQNKYDILNIHSRYNGRDVLTKYMHKDTYVIATLRHPMDQMISALNYSDMPNPSEKWAKRSKIS